MSIEKDQKKNTESIWPHEKRQNNNHVFKLKKYICTFGCHIWIPYIENHSYIPNLSIVVFDI